jgi:hypothetical protein
MKTYPCYQCGYCCTVSNCAYGGWDPEKGQCKFLAEDSTCSKYDEIVRHEKNHRFPMMGCGCSSPLCNDRRAAKMREKGEDPDKELEDMESELGISLDFVKES